MTLAANGLLVQSADHRLSRPDGTDYVDSAPKQMRIQSLGNQVSVVCYAGIGVVSGRGSAADLLYRTASDLGNTRIVR